MAVTAKDTYIYECSFFSVQGGEMAGSNSVGQCSEFQGKYFSFGHLNSVLNSEQSYCMGRK